MEIIDTKVLKDKGEVIVTFSFSMRDVEGENYSRFGESLLSGIKSHVEDKTGKK